ncbi:DNA mismatch repair protein MutL [Polystyrenella longa]|uniref:DNA mismatch repair protein MutL n=1 Tax=Polystyrenella longa TaxID=2528007 RepID=A0A518CK67_9PLAN|nr:DNA mismatch repair endonuclease MutL [Polystyrenella longa]QDU79574.1 DNA mismatch repair protein MutL [Polystyrenella longa]
MPRINQLDAHVVNKIAAGEVIERPASIVKELMENSLDALATRIEVEIVKGGSELIRIVDNGEGIHPDDMLLAISSHATSKIKDADDLFHIHTMGFRGEAVASIASVSRLHIRSRQPDADTGREIEVRSGAIGEVKPCGCPVGTRMEITQLFGNTPVRRKFLKSLGTEFGHISEQFSRIALANPRLHAVLRHNGKTIYELPASENLLDRIHMLHGKELTDKLIWIEAEAGPCRLWGYVGHPSLSRSNRKLQYLFLNNRWIQDRSLQHALGEAYRGLLMVGRHPVSFLYLEIPPETVDVNVHPTKTEVRFEDSQQLYRLLLSTLRTKFLSIDMNSNMSLPQNSQHAAAATEAEQNETREQLMNWANEQVQSWKPQPSQGHSYSPSELAAVLERTDPSSAPFKPFPTEGGSQPTTQVGALSHAELPPSEAVSIPGLGKAIQVLDCYLITETEKGMTIIDQHALHERILYEQFRERTLNSAVESQKLLVPLPIEMSNREVEVLLDNQDVLTQLGFGIADFGKNTVLLDRYPVMLAKADMTHLIHDVTEELDRPGKKPDRRDLIDHLLHTMSCRAAIKAGQRLKPEEIGSLLEQRHLFHDTHHCPHGRPTALTLSRADLDKQFGRLG